MRCTRQRATADYLHRRGADFVLPVKDNQPGLFDALDALPWRDVPVAHTATDRGHGRIDTRTIQVHGRARRPAVPARQPGLPDRAARHRPGRHAAVRHRRARRHQPGRRPAPAPQTIAALVRGQWAIESLHWLRDTLYREDNSTVRTRSGPGPWPRCRNLAVGALHLAGRHDTTEATRWASRDMGRPFTILGLTSRSLNGRGQPLARGRAAIRKMDSTRSDAR